MNTTLSTTLRILVAGAILSSFGFATVSSAEDASAPPQVTVKFGDLEVSTSRGAAALYGRVERAAENVCTRMYVTQVAYKWAKYTCLPKVIGDAVIKVDSPALSAVFASHYGVSPPMLLAAAGTR
jgi:UrcA family protein